MRMSIRSCNSLRGLNPRPSRRLIKPLLTWCWIWLEVWGSKNTRWVRYIMVCAHTGGCILWYLRITLAISAITERVAARNLFKLCLDLTTTDTYTITRKQRLQQNPDKNSCWHNLSSFGVTTVPRQSTSNPSCLRTRPRKRSTFATTFLSPSVCTQVTEWIIVLIRISNGSALKPSAMLHISRTQLRLSECSTRWASISINCTLSFRSLIGLSEKGWRAANYLSAERTLKVWLETIKK